MSNATHKISIAADHHEADEFAAWLREQGHSVEIGNSTGSYVDGVWTSSDENANAILNRLWGEYCAD